ncbi:homeodomain-interacting protein kinase 2-like isoform X1 [Nerophis lumbriciformis]|uniref:homeodomain-interacting protein kinase 2-like isoform X1 n=1 Tax=Nerophis lumbriciformis TaxID=546530 RepID=UPI003BAC5082
MDSYGVFGDRIVPGARLYSASTSYKVLSLLSCGTFGKVAKCRKMDSNKTVAVKMIRNQGSFAEQAKIEIDILQKLKKIENSKKHLVLWNRVFSDMGHICLEFEFLDKNLHDFMKERQSKQLQVKEIRPIIQQLVSALDHLKCAHMIHADVKLENIMLIDHQQQPYRVKVSDFSLAHEASVTKQNSNIQNHSYRSPEILLGAPYNEAIDMWSVGCVTAFLYLGAQLYPGRNEYETIRYIMETQGQFPEDLLASGKKTGIFFQKENKSCTWKLKTPEHYQQETGFIARDTRKIKLSSFNHLLQVGDHSKNFQPWVLVAKYPADKDIHADDKQMFVDMLKGMLHLEASKRMTPSQGLAHQFISMSHLKPHRDISTYTKSCYEIMAQCEKDTSHASKTKSATLQRTSSKSSHSVQQNHTTRKVNSGRNRIRSNDGTIMQTRDLPKRLKIGGEDYQQRLRVDQPSDQPIQKERSPAGPHLTWPLNFSRRVKDSKYLKPKTRFAVRFMEEQNGRDEHHSPTRTHHHLGRVTKASIGSESFVWTLRKDPSKSILT